MIDKEVILVCLIILMTLQDYDQERIWLRLNKKLDLKKFKAAKTDKERRRAFKDALKKDEFGKNILKMQRVNFNRVFDFGTAQQSIDDGKQIKESIKRFTPERQKKITAFEGELRKLNTQEKLFRKAERKGIKVRGIKERPTKRILRKDKFIDVPIGRKPTQKIKLDDVTFSKPFKFGKRTVIGIYKKGIKGVIGLEEVK